MGLGALAAGFAAAGCCCCCGGGGCTAAGAAAAGAPNGCCGRLSIHRATNSARTSADTVLRMAWQEVVEECVCFRSRQRQGVAMRAAAQGGSDEDGSSGRQFPAVLQVDVGDGRLTCGSFASDTAQPVAAASALVQGIHNTPTDTNSISVCRKSASPHPTQPQPTLPPPPPPPPKTYRPKPKKRHPPPQQLSALPSPAHPPLPALMFVYACAATQSTCATLATTKNSAHPPTSTAAVCSALTSTSSTCCALFNASTIFTPGPGLNSDIRSGGMSTPPPEGPIGVGCGVGVRVGVLP